MELLYETKNPAASSSARSSLAASSWFRENLMPQDIPCPLSVSYKNLIAFVSPLYLLRKPTPKPAHPVSQVEPGGVHVYVADLNTPWDCYLVKSSSVLVTNLSWSIKGDLLVACEDGSIGIYELTENFLNKWDLVYEYSLPGESVIASCWLQVPKRVCLNPDRLESMLYSEKYEIRQMLNKNGFGGKSLEGCLVVTATGLVGAFVKSPEDPTKYLSCCEKLLAVRCRISCVDLCYTKDGNVQVASSTGKTNQPVQVNRVSVKLTGSRDKIEIDVKSAQSLFPTNASGTSISSVRFGSAVNTDLLCVGITNASTHSSSISIYELVHHPVELKSRFQAENELIPVFKWKQSGHIVITSIINDIATVALPISTSVPSSSLGNLQSGHCQALNAIVQPVFALALSNGSIQLLRQDTLQTVGLVPPRHIKREIDDSPERKQMKLNGSSSSYLSLRFSWSGSVLVAVEGNHTFSVFKVHPNLDASTATSLIELSIVAGFDPWDILMNLRQNFVESVVDRLSETFARQPPPVQCYYNVKMLVVKAALYRLAIGGQSRSNDQQTLLTLNLVSGALKALLRPSGLAAKDLGPAESLSALLNTKGESLADVDQVISLLHNEAKKFTIETFTLQSVQPLLQWCADLALKLLAVLPDLRHSRTALWEVCRDSKAVSTLRELIVFMRIWGLLSKSCLPSFRRTSDNVDILPHLFRLLTKLSVAPQDLDETLIDECCLLPSEVQIPASTPLTPVKNHGLASSSVLSRNTPLQFEFASNPMKWHVSMEDGNGTWMDGLRLLWLGKNPSGVKVCNRCGIATLMQLPLRSAANKAWDNRWLRSCPCGGHWKIPGYLPQPKVVDADAFLNI